MPSCADYLSRVKQDAIIQMRGSEYEDWFAEPPQVTFDGGGFPEMKRTSCKLRQYIFPFIKLDHGEGVKNSKDDLLKILVAAGYGVANRIRQPKRWNSNRGTTANT